MMKENPTDAPLEGQLCLLGKGISASQKAGVSQMRRSLKTEISYLHLRLPNNPLSAVKLCIILCAQWEKNLTIIIVTVTFRTTLTEC